MSPKQKRKAPLFRTKHFVPLVFCLIIRGNYACAHIRFLPPKKSPPNLAVESIKPDAYRLLEEKNFPEAKKEFTKSIYRTTRRVREYDAPYILSYILVNRPIPIA